MAKLLLVNKPFQCLSQFTDDDGRRTLTDVIDTKRYKGFYAAGRLDYDSEGLLLLTNDGKLQDRIASPYFKLEKTYWVQVEGKVTPDALQPLLKGVPLKDGTTKPAKAKLITQPQIWERNPPIRSRKNDITSWIEIKITEGKNRQVRRMTAAIGFPTLRLIRTAIGHWQLGSLQPGESKEDTIHIPVEPKTKRTRR